MFELQVQVADGIYRRPECASLVGKHGVVIETEDDADDNNWERLLLISKMFACKNNIV